VRRIISLHWGFIPGGVAVYARHLEDACQYAPLKIKSLCLTAPAWPLDKSGIESTNMEILRIRSRLDPSWIWKLRYTLKKGRPNLILTHGFNGAFAAAISGIGLGIPIISSWHGEYFPSTLSQYLRKPVFDMLLKWLFRNVVEEIVTVSDFSRSTLILKRIGEQKITVIHNGILNTKNDALTRSEIRKSLNIPEETLLVGTACRLVAPKGLKWLLKAFALVYQTRQDVRLVIWGDGPLQNALLNQSVELGIASYVCFPGYRPDIDRCLTALDIFIMSSFAENFSIALLEAMRAGLPIIATDVGGNPEAIENGIHGILVPYADPRAMADGIISLGLDVALRERLAANARQRFLDEFTSEKMVRKTAEWLMNCVGKHGKNNHLATEST
jgi:L-malate glycosyltransferase